MSALTDFKRRLEEVLDEHFPKVEEEGPEKEAVRRGAGLCLFAEAIIEANKLVIAFGSCEKCYGKGYNTQQVGAGEGYSDFGPHERFVESEPHIQVNYCSCSRGKQLKELLDK